MAKKKVGGAKDKSKDVSSEKDNLGNRNRGKISKNDKDDINSGGRERVLRSRSTNKGEAKSDEKAKGKKPMREANLTINDEGAQKGGENRKGRKVSGDSDWILKPHNPRQENSKISEKAKGKRKLAVEEENEEKPVTRVKWRRSNKEIAGPNMLSAERGAYNLRARNAVPSFQRVGLSESGLALVVGKRVKVYKSGSRKWLTGKIKSYNDKRKLHKVLYVDGEPEELYLKSQLFEVELMPGEASTLCAKHKPSENLKRQKNQKTNSASRSDDRTVEREKSDEESDTDDDKVISEFAKISLSKKVAKSKPSKKRKKDEGQVNVEKRKNPLGK